MTWDLRVCVFPYVVGDLLHWSNYELFCCFAFAKIRPPPPVEEEPTTTTTAAVEQQHQNISLAETATEDAVDAVDAVVAVEVAVVE